VTGPDELSRAEQAALRGQCTVFLTGHGPVSAAGLLASIPADTAVDRYGDGGVVAELETEIAGLLDKPAAAFLPSGTMAQQSVLRVHADRRQPGWNCPWATPPGPCRPLRSATSSQP